MDIRVLGCHGSKLPGYNTTCFLLDEEILLDAGTITSVLSLEEQIKIEHVLVTHAHLDHVCDIMFLADNLYYSKKEYPAIRVLSTQGVIDALRANLFNNIIWPDFSSIPTPEKPLLKFETVQLGVRFQLNNLTITSVRVNHPVETIGYVIESEKSGSFVFIGDTGPTEDVWEVARKLKNLKAVFVEVSLPNSMEDIADVTGHLTPVSLGRELKKLGAITPDIYLYHMKPQYEETIRKEIDLIENKDIHILSEGEVIKIG
ncbi:MAG: 3',5'-cyclic-nucleotide phosphodiesterase [Syntrophales bacterium]|nr:3',5'-cyclic-nucleotide phosphodiesterase [Syntrophales bacterium]